jgi:hypothetical protein
VLIEKKEKSVAYALAMIQQLRLQRTKCQAALQQRGSFSKFCEELSFE